MSGIESMPCPGTLKFYGFRGGYGDEVRSTEEYTAARQGYSCLNNSPLLELSNWFAIIYIEKGVFPIFSMASMPYLAIKKEKRNILPGRKQGRQNNFLFPERDEQPISKY